MVIGSLEENQKGNGMMMMSMMVMPMIPLGIFPLLSCILKKEWSKNERCGWN